MTNPCLPSNVTNTVHKDVFIGKHVVVGSGTIVLPGVTLNDGCSIGALSLVNKDVDEFKVMAGVPAKFIKDRKRNILELENKIKQ